MIFKRKDNKIQLNLPTTLVSQRVLIKAFELKDWEAWANKRLLSKEVLQPWEPLWASDVLSHASFERRVLSNKQGWDNDDRYCFLVWNRSNNDLIGGITLFKVTRYAENSAFIGYWSSVDYHRQGYMYEGLLKVIEFAFGPLGLHRLQATCMPENIASLNLLNKLSFQQEGLLRQYLNICGKWEDHTLWGLLKEDIFS